MYIAMGVLKNYPALDSYYSTSSALYIKPLKAWVENEDKVEFADFFESLNGDTRNISDLLRMFTWISNYGKLVGSAEDIDNLKEVFGTLRNWMCDEIEKVLPHFMERTNSKEPFESEISKLRNFGLPLHRNLGEIIDVTKWASEHKLCLDNKVDNSCIGLLCALYDATSTYYIDGFSFQIQRANNGFGIDHGANFDDLLELFSRQDNSIRI